LRLGSSTKKQKRLEGKSTLNRHAVVIFFRFILNRHVTQTSYDFLFFESGVDLEGSAAFRFFLLLLSSSSEMSSIAASAEFTSTSGSALVTKEQCTSVK
jgi:hypothetical protein